MGINRHHIDLCQYFCHEVLFHSFENMITFHSHYDILMVPGTKQIPIRWYDINLGEGPVINFQGGWATK